MTTPTQGEHAQTEALRPKFGDLLRNTMASESNPRRDAYFIREVHRSGGGVNPGRWFEMTDGKGETWLSNPQNMVPAATAQPAAPQGVAYAELPTPESYLFQHDETGLTQFVDAQQVEWGFQQKNPRLRRIGGAYTADQMRDFADRTHALRASHGQAPAGAVGWVHPDWRAEHGQGHIYGHNPGGYVALTPTAQTAPAADPAYSEACSLATALFEKHYRQEPDYASGRVVWSLCDTTAGVISQIDNMVSGLARAPAAGAVAGMPPGISALMCVISSLRDTAHFSDEEGELTDELRTLRDWAMTLAAAPTPAAQADSVLEDAARWNEVLMHVGAANHLGGQHFTLNTLRIRDQMFLLRGSVAQHFTACIDDSRAARKQGGA